MSQIIKAFTGVFIALFLMATGVGILESFLQTLQAQNIHGMVIDELENSDYATTVLRENFERTEDHGMELALMLYLENGDVLLCQSKEMVPQEEVKVSMAEVMVTYPLQIPFVGLKESSSFGICKIMGGVYGTNNRRIWNRNHNTSGRRSGARGISYAFSTFIRRNI